jgi:hypothetical protein
MRKIVIFAAMVSLVASVHAQSPTAPAADSVAPIASEPKAEPALAPIVASPQAPVSQTTPAPVAQTAPKPRKKRLAKRETAEHKARRIAAKYGVYW